MSAAGRPPPEGAWYLRRWPWILLLAGAAVPVVSGAPPGQRRGAGGGRCTGSDRAVATQAAQRPNGPTAAQPPCSSLYPPAPLPSALPGPPGARVVCGRCGSGAHGHHRLCARRWVPSCLALPPSASTVAAPPCTSQRPRALTAPLSFCPPPAVLAAARGQAHAIRWLPSAGEAGVSGGGALALELATTLPVLMGAAFTQNNIHSMARPQGVELVGEWGGWAVWQRSGAALAAARA